MPTFRDDLHLGHSVPMVDTEDIVDGAITEPKLADDSVSTRTIQDGAVTEPKIAEKAVTEPKLADAAVSTRTIKFRAVTESKIGDSAVSTRTIQNGAVTNPKIANGAVSMNKLDNETQTLIQRGADSSWTPMGDYDVDALYYANDLVFDPETNSSYLSLRADNMGHAVTDEEWWMKVLDGSYVNLLEEELQQLVDSISEGTQQQVEELNEALEALEAQADQSRQDIQDIVDSLAVVQTTGQSASDVMSQKAVTDEIMTPPQSWDLSYGGDFTWAIGTIHNDGKAYSSSSYYHIYIPVSNLQGGRVKLQAQSTRNVAYAFLKRVGFLYGNNGTDISAYYSSGYNNIIAIPAGQEATFVIPNDCNYLYITCGQISGDVTLPQSNSYYTYKWGDVVQITGDSTHAVMSQKAVTDELEVLGDNLIDMSAMNATTSNTNELSATKDVANNGVIFSVVRNNTQYPPQGRISRMKLITGKRYRLSFEYLNTVVDSLLTLRNSNGGYIPCPTIEDRPALYNTDYAEYVNDFIAPEGAYYLAFMSLTNAAAGKSLTIRNFSCVEVLDIKGKINDIDNDIEQLNNDIDNINNIKADAINIPYYASQAVRTDAGHEGELINRSGCGHSNYTPLYGAKKIYVLAPALGTSNVGIAFYYREDWTSCCGAIGFVHYTGVQESLWKMYDVPEGANFFKMTLYTDTPSQYKIVIPSDYLMELFKQSCQSMIGTQIMRSAVPISDKKYLYAFGAPQYPIIGHKAYVPYGANENTVDGDRIGYPNDSCMSIVDLFDLSHEVVYPINGTKQKADGTPADNAVIGYTTLCATPQGSIASFGLMRFNDNNPYYCYSVMDVASIPSLEPVDGKISPVKNWTTCRLSYNGNTVDFTINNYRQMLVAMGYASSYTASTRDAVDNINIHYDKAEGIYYAVLCGTQESQSMPLVLMQSTDLATWSPKSYLGVTTDANEIGAIYKDGVAYVTYRTASHGMGYLVYDVTNSTLLSSDTFPTSKEMLSKPDVFTFDNKIYMAINVDPSIYGELTYYNNYYLDARQEIAIYKVVNGVPKLFRRVNNPTGIDYFSFTETPPMYATEQSARPMYAQGAIYIAFSEDKRHLYRRQIAQVSFADVTALFADNGRIG